MHICPQEIALVGAICTCLTCCRNWLKKQVVRAAWAVIDRLDP